MRTSLDSKKLFLSSKEDSVPKLLFVTSEIADFVKVGGLGDVSAALPRALRQTNDIRVLIPGYRQVLAGRKVGEVARLPAVAGLPSCGIGRIDMPDGLVVYALLALALGAVRAGELKDRLRRRGAA